MAHYGSIWVKVNNPETDLPLLRENYNPTACLPAGLRFACAIKNETDGETPVQSMQKLSQRFGEAIFMTVQTTVDFFVYSHWRNGELLREMQYCADEGWYALEGEKEDWELLLFKEEEKLRQLSYLDLDRMAESPTSSQYAETQQAVSEIETVWAGQKLLPGCFYPMATASELYQIVMQEFGLTNSYA